MSESDTVSIWKWTKDDMICVNSFSIYPVEFFVNLAQVRVMWEEEPQMKKIKCPYQIACRQVADEKL